MTRDIYAAVAAAISQATEGTQRGLFLPKIHASQATANQPRRYQNRSKYSPHQSARELDRRALPLFLRKQAA